MKKIVDVSYQSFVSIIPIKADLNLVPLTFVIKVSFNISLHNISDYTLKRLFDSQQFLDTISKILEWASLKRAENLEVSIEILQ